MWFYLVMISGLNSKLLTSLWTVTLSVIFIILLGLLVFLIMRVLKMRNRNRTSRQQKKIPIDDVMVTPIHSDDERNPDIIPQIEGNNIWATVHISREAVKSRIHQYIDYPYRSSSEFGEETKYDSFYQSLSVETDGSRNVIVQYVSKWFLTFT